MFYIITKQGKLKYITQVGTEDALKCKPKEKLSKLGGKIRIEKNGSSFLQESNIQLIPSNICIVVRVLLLSIHNKSKCYKSTSGGRACDLPSSQIQLIPSTAGIRNNVLVSTQPTLGKGTFIMVVVVSLFQCLGGIVTHSHTFSLIILH